MPDPRPDPDLTPAQDDAVRALLASARHTDPTPPDVVARLDATLASLSEERREIRPDAQAPVVTLASRRRRTAATLLLAAAAVVVAGVGIGQVLPSGMSGDDAGSSAEAPTSAEDEMSTGDSDRAFGAQSDSTDDGAAESTEEKHDLRAQESAPSPSDASPTDLSALSTDVALKSQVRKLRRLAGATTSTTDPACLLLDAGTGELVPVTYDGRPGALIFRAPAGATQRVDVFVCGEPGAQRSVRLRAP